MVGIRVELQEGGGEGEFVRDCDNCVSHSHHHGFHCSSYGRVAVASILLLSSVVCFRGLSEDRVGLDGSKSAEEEREDAGRRMRIEENLGRVQINAGAYRRGTGTGPSQEGSKERRHRMENY